MGKRVIKSLIKMDENGTTIEVIPIWKWLLK